MYRISFTCSYWAAFLLSTAANDVVEVSDVCGCGSVDVADVNDAA